jgi:Protein of unknown function (DUF2778)
MTDTTATFYGVASFDGRIFPFGDYRRVIRFLVDGVVIGLGTVAAACALVTTVTVAAAWIITIVFATIPSLNVKAPIGPAAIALANPYSTLASAADLAGAARVSTDPADTLTFEAKWAHATAPASTRVSAVALVPQPPVESASNVASLQPGSQAGPELAAATSEKRVTPQQADNKSMPLPDPDSRTAVYDIAAHTVYLPNGDRLEAHSGLGNKLDDPRYVSVKDRGPTPPNVYDLALRERLFHDVRAIRLNPVGGDSMFGRDGMLAHSYMLGPGGQSNGCVAFKDYPAFLHAYLRGEVDRLIVVPHLDNTVLATAGARRGPARRYAYNKQ